MGLPLMPQWHEPAEKPLGDSMEPDWSSCIPSLQKTGFRYSRAYIRKGCKKSKKHPFRFERTDAQCTMAADEKHDQLQLFFYEVQDGEDYGS
jgi:hypothetical protein